MVPLILGILLLRAVKMYLKDIAQKSKVSVATVSYV
ncbi:LacI family DNA-binding transcriptional regulator [Paenibacillus sp. LMG 31458]|uniref:LacI family DNA-binding transcriptional regulator n=1 Tax=Paenibacillus phytorum TaxID=2654977 RepID=A0ABX1Y1I6_9BACL|nr:LacI family DNA-binding transcriptional regulator [Paenibacillus phytorum]